MLLKKRFARWGLAVYTLIRSGLKFGTPKRFYQSEPEVRGLFKRLMKESKQLMYLGYTIMMTILVYFFVVTFTPAKYINDKFANLVIGYVSGVLSAISGFYYGSAVSHKNATNDTTTPEKDNVRDISPAVPATSDDGTETDNAGGTDDV